MKKGVCFIMSAFLCLACMGAAGCSGNGGNNENNNGGNSEDYTPLPEYDYRNSCSINMFRPSGRER